MEGVAMTDIMYGKEAWFRQHERESKYDPRDDMTECPNCKEAVSPTSTGRNRHEHPDTMTDPGYWECDYVEESE
tara:strand:+ start:2690 stop:2911 length:222 start_codon:yes stop_codon:yes gene_type:complete